MRKVIYLFVIVLFSQMFFSCTNEMEEDINQIEKHQCDDYGDDDVADEGN